MVKKKTGASGKHIVKRVDPNAGPQEAQKPSKPEPEKPRIPQRISEKDPGFGVIKTVAAVVIALIVGSMILFNQVGGRESARGDKLPGEQCEETLECATGSICFSYKGRENRCVKRCGKEKECEPGYTCVSASEKKRRKGIRVADICVENAKL
jgi:hypothetical protein